MYQPGKVRDPCAFTRISAVCSSSLGWTNIGLFETLRSILVHTQDKTTPCFWIRVSPAWQDHATAKTNCLKKFRENDHSHCAEACYSRLCFIRIDSCSGGNISTHSQRTCRVQPFSRARMRARETGGILQGIEAGKIK